MAVIPIPYQAVASHVAERLSHQFHLFMLDSAGFTSLGGRYDVIGINPSSYVEYSSSKRTNSVELVEDILEQILPFQHQLSDSHKQEINSDLPFSGGIMMCLSYPSTSGEAFLSTPDLIIGWYPQAVVTDHVKKQSYIVTLDDQACDRTVQAVHDELSKQRNHEATNDFKADTLSTFSREMPSWYEQAITSIHEWILSGDIYQVNYSHPIRGKWQGSELTAYTQLIQSGGGPFSCYIPFSDGAVLSTSPERFFSIKDNQILSSPIKGTTPRSTSSAEDAKQAGQLESSSKDRAENLMIVDLIRNDLGKICQNGSIKVEKLFAVRSYPLVHHLVSDVRGILKQNSPIDILRALWPGGSITGAPKKRSMEIIDQLEGSQRGFYCGTAGYFSICGKADFNILIRTLVMKGDQFECRTGGGIVADSVSHHEYEETRNKIGRLIDALSDSSGSR